MQKNMRKTKIICTLGPSTDDPAVLRQMLEAGMNVARFNFSHGTHADHQARLDHLKALRQEMDLPVAALLDTKGPEIRLRQFENGKEKLVAGQTFTLTTREVPGTNEIVSITYKDLPQDVSAGATILLADGLISMEVESVSETDIVCRVMNDGVISNNKGVNVPDVSLSMPYMSQKDREDILFGVEAGFDFIAASFTRSARDILDIRQVLDSVGCQSIRIIAKIENRQGIENIDEILAVSDGIMIARGDMGVEVDFTQLPIVQKDLIWHCFTAGKPVITATQMLESMMENPRPTRAEISDVANAIYDGTSAIMLSGETAAGKWPVEAVRTMAAIAERTEADPRYVERFGMSVKESHLSVAAATAHAACTIALDTKADAIITVSKSGKTARLMCKYRSETPIIACVLQESVQRHLSLSWGITPLLMPYARNTDELVEFAVQAAEKAGLLAKGDLAVVTAGVPVGVSGTTNMIKIHMVGDALLTGVGVGNHSAKGPLCVCHSPEEVRSKFHPGDVLVLPYTTNSIMEFIRSAAAVITEEGGVSSHAASVCLALDKPAIVGAVGACRNLKDGMFVSVDCERGIVQAMPQL